MQPAAFSRFASILACVSVLSTLGCAPEDNDCEVLWEQTNSTSLPVSGETNSYWQTSRPTFGLGSGRSSVLFSKDKVLVVGGETLSEDNADEECHSAEMFNVVTEKWQRLPSMHSCQFGASAIALPDGRVLVAGGDIDGATDILSADATEWTPGPPLDPPVIDSTAIQLADGRIVFMGGAEGLEPMPAVRIFNPATSAWEKGADMAVARYSHTATLLDDDHVLVAGGYGSVMDNMFQSAEIYNVKTNEWVTSPGMNMLIGRSEHQARRLFDGRVLIFGGFDELFLNSAEIFDPQAMTWNLAASPLTPHYQSASVTLEDGRVLVIGGTDSAGYAANELYDPTLDQWQLAGSLNFPREEHTATLLHDGRLLVTNGRSYMVNGLYLSTTEILDPSLSVWTRLPPTKNKRLSHTATRLLDGRVLLAGSVLYGPQSALYNGKSAELFNTKTSTFDLAAPMTHARASHTATLLPDGRVLVAGGGYDELNGASTGGQTTEFFDPTTNAWSPGPNMHEMRAEHIAIPLSDGRVLVAGGVESDLLNPAPNIELFDPATQQWTIFFETFQPGVRVTDLLQLPDGSIMYAGYAEETAYIGVLDLKGQSALDDNEAVGPINDIKLLWVDEQRVLAFVKRPDILGTSLYSFNPLTQEWTEPTLDESYPDLPFTRLASGELLFVQESTSPLKGPSILDPEIKSIPFPIPGLTVEPPFGHTMTALSDGRVLVAGDGANPLLFGKFLGKQCREAWECGSGFCVDGVCCNEACDRRGSCNACSVVKGAAVNGICDAVVQCNGYQCDAIRVTPDSQEATCKTECKRAADCGEGYACTPDGKCEEPKNCNVNTSCSFDQEKRSSSSMLPVGFGIATLVMAFRRRQMRVAARSARSSKL